MTTSIHRRDCLRVAPLVLLGTATLVPRRLFAVDASGVAAIADSFPAQDPTLVREIVGASHANVAKVAALLKQAPQLAKATHDWGFGDWETALGAASHVGNREIAEMLIAHGARPDLFTFAMLGDVDAVRAAVALRPGIQRLHGPHGLTLMHHARQGGDEAKPVVEYLATLGDADVGHVDVPLDDGVRSAVIGEYVFGVGPSQRLHVFVPERQQRLSIRPEGATPLRLFHQGDAIFHPAGAPDVRIAFTIDGDRASRLTITSPGELATAERVDAIGPKPVNDDSAKAASPSSPPSPSKPPTLTVNELRVLLASDVATDREHALQVIRELQAILFIPEIVKLVADPAPLPRQGDTGWGFVGHCAASVLGELARAIDRVDVKTRGLKAFSFHDDQYLGGAKLAEQGRLDEVRRNWQRWLDDRRG